MTQLEQEVLIKMGKSEHQEFANENNKLREINPFLFSQGFRVTEKLPAGAVKLTCGDQNLLFRLENRG